MNTPDYHGIEFSMERIEAFCRRHNIRRLSLPGLSRYFRDEVLREAEVLYDVA